MSETSGKDADEPWISGQREYEGFPLYLRYPASLDYDALKGELPFRLVLTHTFSFRRFDGAPEPRYNETLEEFDLLITGFFRDSGRGQIVLVETFGGKRNYYFYLRSAEDEVCLTQAAHELFRGQRIATQVASDPDWRFIRRYRAEILDAA